MSNCIDCENFNIKRDGCEKDYPIIITYIHSQSHSLFNRCGGFKKADNDVRSRT